ncbi:Ubiquitin-conjugating enzyme E2 6 [Dispira simplex]|nr:Ubiquitin-conjugating enzyme E2 6 [Dispira simplex]
MASQTGYKRLVKEYKAIQQSPPPYITAKPLDDNILEWHYVLRGPQDTPYEAGEYHGVLKFPSAYPYKPPAIQMITPNGRFQIDTNICTTMSNFHPNLWNPAWSVATILNGLLSFMVEEETTTGSIRMTNRDRRILAERSHRFNLKNSVFREVFPELCKPELNPLPEVASSKASLTTPSHSDPTGISNELPAVVPVPRNTALDDKSGESLPTSSNWSTAKGKNVQFFTPHGRLRERRGGNEAVGHTQEGFQPMSCCVAHAAGRSGKVTEECCGSTSEGPIVAPAAVTTTAAAQARPRRSWWFNLAPCRKIYLFLFIVAYLVAAKLISRAMSSTL